MQHTQMVTVLPVTETAKLDPQQLQFLNSNLGTAMAEELICRSLEELATRLGRLERAFAADDVQTTWEQARGIVAVAEQIGMVGLGRVARDVVRCAARGDATALAATVHRLMRVGETSLTMIWDLQDEAF